MALCFNSPSLSKSESNDHLPQDGDETWILSYGAKKKIYGPQMVRVGGKNEQDETGAG